MEAPNGLPAVFFDLIAEYGTPDQGPIAEQLNGLLDRLHDLPVSIAEQVGEPLLVHGHCQHYDQTRLTWIYDLIGQESGTRWGSIRFIAAGDHLQDSANLDSLALTLRMALNRPWTLPDEVFHAYSELTGWSGLECDYCPHCFPDWRTAEAHEWQEHGIAPRRDRSVGRW
jgi:hypothetical protein